MAHFIVLLASLLHITVTRAQEPDWSRNYRLPIGENRANIYQIPDSQWPAVIEQGQLHALVYPVGVSGLFVPYEPLIDFLQSDHDTPLQDFIYRMTQQRMPFKNIEGMYQWLGLTPYPGVEAEGIFRIPYPGGKRPDYYMGAGIVDTSWGKGLTFSCATCHSFNMFGKPVLGLTNKRTRANHFFHMAKQYVPKVPSELFQLATNATNEEKAMFSRTKSNLSAVGIKEPQTVGLDTSLSQVALSLAKRNRDAYATKNPMLERFPRQNQLEQFVADSKPAVWWNLKYKTRWLSDGSIVSGNPIFTNFLWNELGRGTDLKQLEQWMQNNQATIKQLTAAVFATQAPHWTDFFPANSIDLAKAKRGEKIFQQSCQQCHGEYRKQWPLEGEAISAQSLKTTQVIYHDQTPVKDVGTDSQRYKGMKYFADDLNKLQISKWMGTVVEPQVGYVPPPLIAIWMRYPYLHNNSVPTLCALLTEPSQRPRSFYQGPAEKAERDFDQVCVGYPIGDKIPAHWKQEPAALVDTQKPGLRNIGHYKMLLDDQGQERYSWEQKRDLIEFLKTL